jgi:hypothetical protein
VNFTETDEQRALRAAVADLGARYGYAYFMQQARGGGRLTSCGRRRAGSASWGSTCPRSMAAAAPACTSCRWCWKNWPRQGAACC